MILLPDAGGHMRKELFNFLQCESGLFSFPARGYKPPAFK